MVDALAAAPLAARYGAPIFLADRATVPPLANAATRSKTVNAKIIALGGTGAVSPAILAAFAGGADTPLTEEILANEEILAGVDIPAEQLALQPEYTSADIEAYNLAIAEETAAQALGAQREAQVSAKIEEIIAAYILPDMSDLEKERVIHDYLITHSTYEWPASSNLDYVYSPYGLLIRGRGCCSAYASTMKRFMDRLDVPCEYVSAKRMGTTGCGHAWNRVMIDGLWYELDVTWDEPEAIFGDVSIPYTPYAVGMGFGGVGGGYVKSTLGGDMLQYSYMASYRYFNNAPANFGHDGYVWTPKEGSSERDMPLNTIYAARTMAGYTDFSRDDIRQNMPPINEYSIESAQNALVQLGIRSDIFAPVSEGDRSAYKYTELLIKKLRSWGLTPEYYYMYSPVERGGAVTAGRAFNFVDSYALPGSASADYPLQRYFFAKDRPLRLPISLGAEPLALPNFSVYTNDSLGDAIRAGAFGNLTLSIEYDFSADVPNGSLISQQPLPGALSDRVTLVFCRKFTVPGQEQEQVPAPDQSSNTGGNNNNNTADRIQGADFIGLTLDEAQGLQQSLAEQGIIVTLTHYSTSDIYSDTVPAGRIAAQNPPAGTQLPADRTVEVGYGLSFGPVPVNGFIGLTLDEAWVLRQTLAARQIWLNLSHSSSDDIYSDTVPEGRIAWQDPPPGTDLPMEATVKVGMSLGPAPIMPDVSDMEQ
jgi:beta-lactam-binding protein with PASTA domain